MNIQPYGDRILVEREVAVKETPGGILLPDQAQKKPFRGKILAVGEGRRNTKPTSDKDLFLPISVQVGQTVLFNRYGGESVPGDEEGRLLLLREDDILATLEE